MLTSGLPEYVSDDEHLSRFLTSSSHYSVEKRIVKPAAFFPAKVSRETSVFRQGAVPATALWDTAGAYLGHLNVHAAAVLPAADARQTGLNPVADEPPPRHAALRGWPWFDDDPELTRSRHKEIAQALVRTVTLVLR
jgi:hypothetical protein